MNKTVMISGATSGIGKACAHKFAKEGFRLIITGRRKDRLEKLAAVLKNTYNSEILARELDVRDKIMVKKLIDNLTPEWRSIDVLINNAGLALGLSPLQDGDTDDWDTMIDTNVKGLLYVGKAVAQLMIVNGRGHIINIGSIAGKEVYPKGNVYSATKHAVDAITKGMRLDFLGHGIRVTQIAPGAVETEFSIVRFKGDENRAAKVYENYTPLSADDVAGVAYYTTTLPEHVNINDVLVMPTQQANATTFNKKFPG
ncbi:MAG: SDR family NAD(P)-dependent oxidoreductase [Bacteroidales bacterium]|nr:SDR family NAD(P)-dependent oxidoreductase [Bacteroidales bacterium]